MRKTKILIYDSISTGHHLDYLFYLIHQASHRKHVELVVVCSEKIRKNLNDFSFPIEEYPEISFDFLPEKEIERLHHKHILSRSIAEWNKAVQIAHKHQAEELLFPYFDYFQLGALLGNTPNLKVSGILFNANVVHSVYAFVKKTVLKTVLRQHFFDTLFVLTEDSLQDVKNLTHSKNIIYLPDPIFQFPENILTKKALEKQLSIDASKTVFLNFGYLDSRKGIIEFLEACQLLDNKLQEKIHLILAGKIASDVQDQLENLLHNCPGITTSKLFEHQLPENIQYLFQIADWSLVLYPKFLGSSSVLIRSAMANKPVMGNKIGSIGKLIEKYQLGIAIDPEDRQAIAHSLQSILENQVRFESKGMQFIAQKHHVNNFGKIVYEALANPFSRSGT